MEQPSFLRTTALGLAFACLACSNALNAQLVLIPDPGMREWYDTHFPGVVDANGYLDTAHPDLATVQAISLYGDLGITAIQGLQYFPNVTRLDLLMGSSTFTMDAWPPSLTELFMDSGSAAQVPPLPVTITALWISTVGNTSFPVDLPPALVHLEIIGAYALTVLPPLPTSLETLYMEDADALQTLGPLPNGLRVLDISNAAVLNTIPALPPTLEGLMLSYCPLLIELCPIPATVSFMSLFHLPVLDPLPAYPPGVTTLYADSWMIDAWGVLPESLESLGVVCNWMEAYENGDPYPGMCLPPLPASLQYVAANNYPEIPIVGTCLPNWPPQLVSAHFYLGNDDSGPIYQGIEQCVLPDVDCLGSGTYFEGMRFSDANGNGLMDGGEQALPYGMVMIEPGGIVAAGDGQGRFGAFQDPGAYTVSALPSLYHTATTPPQIATVPLAGAVDSLDAIGSQPIPGMHDLVVDLWCNVAKPGFETTCSCALSNIGTEEESGSLQLSIDADQEYVGSDVVPTSVAGNDLIWNVPSIAPGATLLVTVTLSTDVAVPLGTALVHTLSFSAANTDLTPANNTINHEDVVVGSWDPNDKRVSPTVMDVLDLQAGSPLTYTIRFQNTGTYAAERVVLVDTLSADLQWNTINGAFASHPNTWSIQNGVLYVVFDNINLPDSASDPLGSQGYFRFRMKPANTLGLGAEIVNRAHIFFDFNPPITTGDAVCVIEGPNAVREMEPRSLQLAPVPVMDVLQVTSPQPANSYRLVDATGRVCAEGGVPAATTWPVDVASLPPGMYTLLVQAKGSTYRARFVKR